MIDTSKRIVATKYKIESVEKAIEIHKASQSDSIYPLIYQAQRGGTESMLEDLRRQLAELEQLRMNPLPNSKL